jgi:polysaccharide pyruvyl transferase CsaB
VGEILVSGYYGFRNAGDEAILGGLITAVRALDPSVRFTVISGKAAHTRALHGVEAISRGDFKKIWAEMARSHLLISGGGSLLQDVTSLKTIPYYLGVASMAKLRGLPVMFYAQGIGPVTRLVGRGLVPLVGNWIDHITVRDEDSARRLRQMGVFRPPIEVTADAALALGPADPEMGRRLLAEHGVKLDGRPIIGVSIRPWKYVHAQVEQALAQGLDELAERLGATILFIPMQQPHDVAVSRATSAMMKSRPVVLEGDFTYRQIQAVIGCCDLLIGMRYHALVFAAMAGTPLVGLSYDPKNDSFLRLLGQEAVGTAQRLNASDLTAAAHEMLAGASAVRQRYRAVMERLTPLSHRNARIVMELLEARRKG